MGTIDATEQLLATKDAEIRMWAQAYLELGNLILRIPIESRPAQLHMHIERSDWSRERAREIVNPSSY